MSSLWALPFGLILPTIIGWLLLKLLEGRTPVLFRIERWVMGLALGLMLSMFVHFLLQAYLGVPFSSIGFLGTQAGIASVFGVIAWKRGLLPLPSPHAHTFPHPSRLVTATLLALLGWTAVKIAMAGTVFTLLTPSYLQDTVNNWNLRGKVFYETQSLTLVMPNEDATSSPLGVSSYPPTVPMVKAMLGSLAGEWSDPLINSIHIIWFLCALAVLYFAIRRYASPAWSALGVYVLASLPLYLMHGTNAYADAFVSVHVLIAVSTLLHAWRSDDGNHAMTFLRIAAVSGAVLPFTKNEGMLVFLPPFLLCFALATFLLRKRRVLEKKQALQIVLWLAIALLVLAGPWLLFKWQNGLTFGNAKSVTGLGFGWQERVLFAVTVNTFSEGNWLLLFPLFFGLILWRWREVVGPLLIPLLYFLLIYFGQVSLYLFTSLSREALLQTGYARGLIQLAPVICMLCIFLLKDASHTIKEGLTALAETTGLKPR